MPFLNEKLVRPRVNIDVVKKSDATCSAAYALSWTVLNRRNKPPEFDSRPPRTQGRIWLNPLLDSPCESWGKVAVMDGFESRPVLPDSS